MYGISLNKGIIKDVLEDFYLLTNIRIAFYSVDYREYIAYPQNPCNFCRIIRKNQHIDNKCRECDGFAFKQAEQLGNLYLYECHAGLYEAISPIISEGCLLGYLMIGQVLPQVPTLDKWNDFCRRYKYFDLDFLNIKSAYFQLNNLSREKIHAAARMMDRSAKYIYLSKFIKKQPSSKIQKFIKYIEENSYGSISVTKMSNNLGISRSYLDQLVREEFNTSPSNYIIELKMNKAKELLEQREMTVKEIANTVGYADQNYFSRIFKKFCGMTPTQYRELLSEDNS